MSIIFLLLIFFMFYLIQLTLIEKNWHRDLEVDIRFKDKEIFEGESTELLEEVRNNKLIPVWWLGLQMSIPRFIVFNKEEELKPRAKELRRKDFFTILSYEKLRKSLSVTAFKRGYYKIDEAVVSSGDLFNIYKFMLNKSYNASLTVYPRLIDTPEFKMYLNKLTGEVITKRHIIEDPFIFRGIRDYTINDSMKLVNWKASAKGSDLKVNEYDFAASQEVLILVNTEGFNQWDSDFLIEESLRLASSIASSFIEKGIPVGIRVNSPDFLGTGEVMLVPKNGKANLLAILEALARVDVSKTTISMKEVIEQETMRREKSCTIILISYYYNEELINEFKLSAIRGFDISWVLPKLKDEEIKLQETDNLHIWEVSEDERRIY
jgi:uncharacterized protein (DUF58 family)